MARKELKLLDTIPTTVTILDNDIEFLNGFTKGASWRDKSEYRKKHKRMIKKSLRSALKSQLDKDLRKEYTTPEITEITLDNEISLALCSHHNKPPWWRDQEEEQEQTPFY